MTKRNGISSLPGHELPFKIQRNQSPFLYRIVSSSLLKDVANYCHAVIAIRCNFQFESCRGMGSIKLILYTNYINIIKKVSKKVRLARIEFVERNWD